MKETVTGNVYLIREDETPFSLSVDSITMGIWGGISVQSRPNKP